jgi:hypothetical protein
VDVHASRACARGADRHFPALGDCFDGNTQNTKHKNSGDYAMGILHKLLLGGNAILRAAKPMMLS